MGASIFPSLIPVCGINGAPADDGYTILTCPIIVTQYNPIVSCVRVPINVWKRSHFMCLLNVYIYLISISDSGQRVLVRNVLE